MTGKNKKMNFPVFKAIKISKAQDENWNPKLIRSVLENNPIKLLEFYNNFFKDNIDYLLKDTKISEYILNHEEFDKVEEIIKVCQV